MYYEFGWLPDDMSVVNEYKLRRSSDGAGITPMLYKNIGDLELVPMSTFDFPTKEEYDLEGKHVTIFYASKFHEGEPDIYRRNIWITFEGSDYAVFLYVTDNLETDTLKKIIENISLVPSEKDWGGDLKFAYEQSNIEIKNKN